jgi:hypothetical protein
MPVSEVSGLSPIVAEIERINPVGMIDIGVGFGAFGCLARNYLDGRWGRCKKEQWAHRIVGVEAFESYENPCWGVYDEVYICDVAEYYREITGWGLVLAIDSMEHLEKQKALDIIDYLLTHNEHLILSIPLGKCPQTAVFGNEFERHRSTWYPHEFEQWPNRKILYEGVCMVVALRGKQQ